jgi:hypothetical protein
MRIEIDNLTGSAKVVEPSFASGDVYLDREVVDFLESSDRLNDLEKMKLIVNSSLQRWEISDKPPVAQPGTIGSVLFSVGGSLYTDKDSNRVTCRLP